MDKNKRQKDLEDMVNQSAVNKPVGIIRLNMIRESRFLYGAELFTSPDKAADLVRPLLTTADREMVVVMSLTAKLEALAVEIVAVGGLDACSIDIRNIFKHSLLNNAACIMCFHNHPSGDPKPSQEDYQITRRMEKAGEILGVNLVDHIIIGDGKYFSFKEQGMLDGKLMDSVYGTEEKQ